MKIENIDIQATIDRARSLIDQDKQLSECTRSMFELLIVIINYPISTGPLEGTNSKIKTMKRQVYGFRDKKFFKIEIMALHLTRYA